MMFKKRVLLSIVFASSNLIGMFGVLPGQVQSHTGYGVAAPRLASISENPAAAATATAAANVADSKSGGEKKAKEPRPIKSLKPVATRIVIRKSKLPGPVFELYGDPKLIKGPNGFIKGIPFKQLFGINLVCLLQKNPVDLREFKNQCSSWAIIDEKTEILDQTK